MPAQVILQVPCPADVCRSLSDEGLDREGLNREAQEGLALRLYTGGRLSLGKAAEVAGLPLIRFMDLLRSLGLPVVEYGEEEYAQDMRTIEALHNPAQPSV
jgi:predicted HTH domain antitoxin